MQANGIALEGLRYEDEPKNDGTGAATEASSLPDAQHGRRRAIIATDEQAAIIIQALVRGAKVRSWKQKLAAAATKIQASFRMQRQREATQRQLDAVVAIQASFRGRRSRSISHGPNSPTALEIAQAARWPNSPTSLNSPTISELARASNATDASDEDSCASSETA